MARQRSGKRTHRRDRVVRRFLMLGAFLALLGFFAPAIIGGTSLLGTILARAVPAEAGRVTAGGASLGWFSSVSLRQVQVRDATGQVLMHADALTLDRTLWQLMTNSSNLGNVRVDRPVLYAVVRPDGSNLEDFIAALDQPTQPPAMEDHASQSTNMNLTIVGGCVAVADVVTGSTTIHDSIDVQLAIASGLQSLKATGLAHAAVLAPGQALPVLPLAEGAGQGGGQFRLELTPQPSGANRADFLLDRMRLAHLAPWLRRVDPRLELDGVAEGRGAFSWWPSATATTAAQQITSTGNMRLSSVRIASQTFTSAGAEKPLAIERADLDWRVTTTAQGLVQIDRLAMVSDFAKASVTGAVTTDELTRLVSDQGAAGDWTNLPTAPTTAARLSADIDLARLGRVAPRLMHLRPGVSLASGQIRLAADLKPSPSGPGKALAVKLATANLVASSNGEPVRWDQPILLRLAGQQSSAGWRLARLACESSFLNGQLSGEPTDLTGSLTFDLDTLFDQARQLFDLGGWRLAGHGGGQFKLQRAKGNRFKATGKANVDGCIITHNNQPIVEERELTIELNAIGKADPTTHRPIGFDKAMCLIAAGGDVLNVQLTEPTALTAKTFPLDLAVEGDLGAWVRRAKVVSMAYDMPLQAAGTIAARAVGRIGAERVELASMDVTATGVRLRTDSLAIDEPEIKIRGDLAWDSATGAMASRGGQLVSSAVKLQAHDLIVRDGQATGDLAVRANVARLASWAPTAMGDTLLAGQLAGTVRLVTGADGSAVANVDLTTQQFALAERTAGATPRVLWQEPSLNLRGVVAHSRSADRLTLTGLAVQSQNLSATLGGQINQLSTAPAPQLNGTVDYDLAQLTPVVAQYLGPGVQLAGQHQAQFELASVPTAAPTAHWSRRWTGRVAAPWTSASLYGLPVGQGVISATLGEGLLRCDPLVFGLGQGQLTTQPAVRFDPLPAEWGLPAGPLLTDVLITREVSEKMLKFIAPVLADATRSEGLFSLRTEGVRAPMDDPSGIETTGQLAVSQVRVVPGPAVAEWVSIARQVEALAKDRDPAALLARPAPTLLSISQRTVNFQIAAGRVYHQGLAFDVGDVPVVSNGSVGFDETLQITLTVPIQEKWIAGERRLVGLRGQSIQVPVGGTLSKPRIDRRALQGFSRQLIQQGVEGAIQGEIGRALEKLFD